MLSVLSAIKTLRTTSKINWERFLKKAIENIQKILYLSGKHHKTSQSLGHYHSKVGITEHMQLTPCALGTVLSQVY